MRCPDLAATWADLTDWFDRHEILVLPQLSAGPLVVQLDADVDQDATAGSVEMALVTGRLRSVIEQFGVRAVYVRQAGPVPVGPPPVGAGPVGAVPGDAVRRGPGEVTVRVVAGGVVHELNLFASWYIEFLDEIVGVDFAHMP
jgi:hypothetical protein